MRRFNLSTNTERAILMFLGSTTVLACSKHQNLCLKPICADETCQNMLTPPFWSNHFGWFNPFQSTLMLLETHLGTLGYLQKRDVQFLVVICGPRCVVRQVHLQNDLDTRKLQLQKLGRPLSASNQYSCIFLAWFGTECGKKQKLHCFWNGTVITGFRPEPRVHVSSICESNTARYFCRIIFNWALSSVPILPQFWKYPDQISTFFVFLSYHVLILLPNNLWLDQSYLQSQWMGNIFGWHPPYVFHPVGFTIAVDPHMSRGGLRSGPVFWGLISFSNAALVYTSSMLCSLKHLPISQGVPTWFCNLYR